MPSEPDARIAAAAASELIRQHAQREPFRPLDGELSLNSTEIAYRVQDAYVARLAEMRGTRVCGYKIALTTRAMREMVGFHDSIAGYLLEDRLLRSGQSVRAADYGRLIVEFEIAFRIASNLPQAVRPWDRHSIFEYVACAYPALEIADDRNADYAGLAASVLTLVADNAWNQGLVLGAAIGGADADRLLRVEGIATSDSTEIGRGTGRDVLGHPLDALAWLANHLESRGMALAEGSLVTTGSLVRSHFPNSGSALRFELVGMGDVRLDVR